MTSYRHLSNPSQPTTILVWDILMRIFHWSLVVFFTFSYLTGDDAETLHIWSGYTLIGLLAFRIVWGFIGPTYARFANFVRSPVVVIRYLQSMRAGRAKRYIGHNPVGAMMIVLLLLGLAFMGFTGLLLAGYDGYGPLMNTALMNLPHGVVQELHEAVANLMVIAVLMHIAGVVLSSRLHKENLPKAMLTGRKAVEESHHD